MRTTVRERLTEVRRQRQHDELRRREAAESRAKGQFQFAREKEEPGTIVDLPNPLRPRRLDS
jgi:hypothetical protein